MKLTRDHSSHQPQQFQNSHNISGLLRSTTSLLMLFMTIAAKSQDLYTAILTSIVQISLFKSSNQLIHSIESHSRIIWFQTKSSLHWLNCIIKSIESRHRIIWLQTKSSNHQIIWIQENKNDLSKILSKRRG